MPPQSDVLNAEALPFFERDRLVDQLPHGVEDAADPVLDSQEVGHLVKRLREVLGHDYVLGLDSHAFLLADVGVDEDGEIFVEVEVFDFLFVGLDGGIGVLESEFGDASDDFGDFFGFDFLLEASQCFFKNFFVVDFAFEGLIDEKASVWMEAVVFDPLFKAKLHSIIV